MQGSVEKKPSVLDLLTLTIFSVFLYFFMEWLFIITKPSLTNLGSIWTKIEVVVVGVAIGSALSAVFLLVLIPLDNLRFRFQKKLPFLLSSGVPAFWLAGLILLLVDNFTYTVLHYGIVSTAGIFRGLYGLAFILVFGWCAWLVLGWLNQGLEKVLGLRKQPVRKKNKSELKASLLSVDQPKARPERVERIFHNVKLGLCGLMLVGILGVALTLRNNQGSAMDGITLQKRPNIILIGSDGVNAVDMSLYGYARDTTPNLKALAQNGLLVENNISNAGNTSGSTMSILTGKYPSKTRVMYPPDIFQGLDAYQHLPGILRQAGYYSVEYGAPYYADSNVLGMLNGFQEVNGRSSSKDIYSKLMNAGFDNNNAYFLSSLYDRISSRILHIFYIQKWENPFTLIMENVDPITDEQKVSNILQLIQDHPNQPVFVHAHLMGTHGGWFKPTVKKFSVGVDQTSKWMTAYYDDAIYNFDLQMGRLVSGLGQLNELDNTVIIVYSDHGEKWEVRNRIPLLFVFPKGEGKGLVHDGQNLDIAPTLLDYLGATKPAWMTGISLLQPENSILPVLSFGTKHSETDAPGLKTLDQTYNKPPFYQFDYVVVTSCQQWYRLSLETFRWAEGTLKNYSKPCASNQVLTGDQAQQAILDRLRQDGFSFPGDFLTRTKYSLK